MNWPHPMEKSDRDGDVFVTSPDPHLSPLLLRLCLSLCLMIVASIAIIVVRAVASESDATTTSGIAMPVAVLGIGHIWERAWASDATDREDIR